VLALLAKRWETLTALAAVVAASLAAIAGPAQLWLVGIAVALLAIVCAGALNRYLKGKQR